MWWKKTWQIEASLLTWKIVFKQYKNNVLQFWCRSRKYFSELFFCSKCKEWENRAKENKRLHRRMIKFNCAANHSSCLTLSTKDKTWCKSKLQPCGTAVTNASERVSERGRKIMRTKGRENQKTEIGSTVLLCKRKIFFKWLMVLRLPWHN